MTPQASPRQFRDKARDQVIELIEMCRDDAHEIGIDNRSTENNNSPRFSSPPGGPSPPRYEGLPNQQDGPNEFRAIFKTQAFPSRCSSGRRSGRRRDSGGIAGPAG